LVRRIDRGIVRTDRLWSEQDQKQSVSYEKET